MPQQTQQVWEETLSKIQGRVSGRQFETWFRRMHPVDIGADSLVLGIPAAFYREWIEKHYLTILQQALNETFGRDVKISFVVDAPQHKQLSFDWQARSHESALQQEAPLTTEIDIFEPLQLNDKYVFEDFVVGPSNRLAHAAAVAVSESPGRTYNPLFIQGSVGPGKTHLLQAICHAVRRRDPSVRILMLPCEAFVNKFIAAVQQGSTMDFRNRCRSADMLVIDDVHFLANKERTQEEFFHTFNALYNAQKQIVLSSDCAPHEIPTLEERVVSRFKWGMVANIEPPCFETRAAIARKKAHERGRELPNEVALYLAENIETNIRELEGAVVKIIGYASLINKEISMETAKEALRDVLQRGRRVRMEDVRNAVLEYYKIKPSDLKSRSRSKSVAFPRQVCMYLARKHTNCSLEEIGSFLGGRDHTTVLYAEEKISQEYQKNPQVKHDINLLSKKLTQGA